MDLIQDKPDKPAEIQWFRNDREISDRLKKHDITAAARYISGTFTPIAEVLIESCNYESNIKLQECKSAQDDADAIANFSVSAEPRDESPNSNSNSNSNNNKNKNKNQNMDKDKNTTNKSKTQTKTKTKTNKNKKSKRKKGAKRKGKKSSVKNKYKKSKSKSPNPIDTQTQWRHALYKNQAMNAYLLTRTANLTNKSLQTIFSLNKTRVKNIILHASGSNQGKITNKEIENRFIFLWNHLAYSPFIKPLLRRVEEAFPDQIQAISRDNDEMETEISDIGGSVFITNIIKVLLKEQLGRHKHIIFADLELQDILKFNHNASTNVPKDVSNKTKKYETLVDLWEHWQFTDAQIYIIFKRAYFMATGHFASLSDLFAPKLWNTIKYDSNCVLEKEFKEIVPIVLSQESLDDYTRQYNKIHNNNNNYANDNSNDDYENDNMSEDDNDFDDIDDVTTEAGVKKDYSIPPKVVKAMQTQLQSFLMMQCKTEKSKNTDEWIKKAYYVVVFGFMVPLFCLNHVEILRDQESNKIGPLITTCYPDGQSKHFWRHIYILVTLLLKWLRATAIRSWASIQLQPGRINTVFPGGFHLLMKRLKNTNGKFGDICQFICMLPNIIYCAYFDSKVNGTGNGLATGISSMVKSRFNWMSDDFWKRTPNIIVPSNRKKTFGMVAPITAAVPLMNGEIYAALTTQKFPKHVYSGNYVIAVFLDQYIPGFHWTFKDSNGLRMPIAFQGIFQRFFNQLGHATSHILTPEAFWSMIYKNTKKLANKFVCFITVSKPVGKNSQQAKYLYNNFGRLNSRMFFVCKSIV